MSTDRPREWDTHDGLPDLPKETTDKNQLDALDRFAKYTAPAMLALLLSDRVATASLAAGISDIRVERDITLLGRLPNGLSLYRYRYLWSDTSYVGVMAHEVASVHPDAAMRGADGYLHVDYARLGLRLQTWDHWVATA